MLFFKKIPHSVDLAWGKDLRSGPNCVGQWWMFKNLRKNFYFSPGHKLKCTCQKLRVRKIDMCLMFIAMCNTVDYGEHLRSNSIRGTFQIKIPAWTVTAKIFLIILFIAVLPPNFSFAGIIIKLKFLNETTVKKKFKKNLCFHKYFVMHNITNILWFHKNCQYKYFVKSQKLSSQKLSWT